MLFKIGVHLFQATINLIYIKKIKSKILIVVKKITLFLTINS